MAFYNFLFKLYDVVQKKVDIIIDGYKNISPSKTLESLRAERKYTSVGLVILKGFRRPWLVGPCPIHRKGAQRVKQLSLSHNLPNQSLISLSKRPPFSLADTKGKALWTKTFLPCWVLSAVKGGFVHHKFHAPKGKTQHWLPSLL